MPPWEGRAAGDNLRASSIQYRCAESKKSSTSRNSSGHAGCGKNSRNENYFTASKLPHCMEIVLPIVNVFLSMHTQLPQNPMTTAGSILANVYSWSGKGVPNIFSFTSLQVYIFHNCWRRNSGGTPVIKPSAQLECKEWSPETPVWFNSRSCSMLWSNIGREVEKRAL